MRLEGLIVLWCIRFSKRGRCLSLIKHFGSVVRSHFGSTRYILSKGLQSEQLHRWVQTISARASFNLSLSAYFTMVLQLCCSSFGGWLCWENCYAMLLLGVQWYVSLCMYILNLCGWLTYEDVRITATLFDILNLREAVVPMKTWGSFYNWVHAMFRSILT